MHKENLVKIKMPFLNTIKTATAVGLLMQQATAMCCPEDSKISVVPYVVNTSARVEAETTLQMGNALHWLSELTSILNRAYVLLVDSNDDNREFIITTLDPEKSELIELQLRGLEGSVRNVFKECPEDKKKLLKPHLVVIAEARSAASKLNSLIKQITNPVETFTSNIDREGLLALAKYGTDVFVSGRFH